MSDKLNGNGKALAHLAPEWLRPYCLSGEADHIFPIRLDMKYPVSTFGPTPSSRQEVARAWKRVYAMLDVAEP